MTATLLAIDDSKTMRKVLEITFAGEDYRTVLSESASDALAKLRSERPAVVLLDAILGDTNGYDLCQRIKAEAPQVGVIILSSKQHPYDRARGTAAGADDYIDKPFDTQALIDKTAGLAHRLAESPSRPVASAPAAAPAPRIAHSPVASQPMQSHQPLSRVGSAAPVAKAPPPPAQPTGVAASSVATASAAIPVGSGPAPSSGMGSLESKLHGLGLTRDQVVAVLAISQGVVEQVVWEVVPVLAEAMIREEILRLTAE